MGGVPLATAAGGAALEPLDPAAGIHQLLLAGVERMAGGADLHVKLRLRGARIELVIARAPNVRQHVLGVDPSLHPHRFLPPAVSALVGLRVCLEAPDPSLPAPR